MKIVMLFLAVMLLAVPLMPLVLAEDDAGVAGCGSLKINPQLSLEDQQSICNAAEKDPSTSCSASGHGTCSSPKYNDTLPDADHCICVAESADAAPADDSTAEPAADTASEPAQ